MIFQYYVYILCLANWSLLKEVLDRPEFRTLSKSFLRSSVFFIMKIEGFAVDQLTL